MQESVNVNINGLCFEVIEEADGKNVWLEEDEKGYTQAGLCEFFKQKIYIHKDLGYKMKRRILVHELTHAFLFVQGLHNVDLNQEIICDFVALNYEKIKEIVDDYFIRKE